MPQKQNRPAALAARAEAEFEHVAEGALAMHLRPTSQCARMSSTSAPHGIHGGLVVGRRLGPDKGLNQFEKRRSLRRAPASSARMGTWNCPSGAVFFGSSTGLLA